MRRRRRAAATTTTHQRTRRRRVRSRSPICPTARARSVRSSSRTSPGRTWRSSSTPAARPPVRSRPTASTGAKVGDAEIEIVGTGCADDTADKAIEETRRLMEQEDADILIGPLSGDEGIAVANYAKEHPDKTFINGTSGAQDTTLKVQAPNFFRFHSDGAQWSAGLGDYAYNELGWKTAADHRRRLLVPVHLAGRLRRRVLRGRREGHQAHLAAAGREGLLVLHLPDPGRRRRHLLRHRRRGPGVVHEAVRGAEGQDRPEEDHGQRVLRRPAGPQGGLRRGHRLSARPARRRRTPTTRRSRSTWTT